MNLWMLPILIVVLLVGVVAGRLITPSPPDEPIPFERPTARIGEEGGGALVSFVKGRRAAIRIWGQACGGRVTIKAGRLRGRQGESAEYDYEPGLPLDPRRYGRCVIIVNSALSLTVAQRCALIVHGWGHLTAHGHVKDPDAIMFPRLSSRNIPRSCM